MTWQAMCVVNGARVGDVRRRDDTLQSRCYELRRVLALIQSSGERSHWDTLGLIGSVAEFYSLFAT